MDLSGKKVTVLGAAKSGIAAAALLHSRGAQVLVSELGRIGEAAQHSLHELNIPFEEEGHSGRIYDADLCVISPGIPPTAKVVQAMQQRGIAIFSEIEIAALFCRARVVGITGTDGKTTTATLIHRICEADGLLHNYRAFSVGNIGIPFSSMVLEMHPRDVAVVELSSYQLERCVAFRPDIAVITNITPDHLARYEGDMHRYAAAKFRIYQNQGERDTLIYNDDDPLLSAHFAVDSARFPFQIVPFRMDQRAADGSGRSMVFLENDRVVFRTVSGEETVVATADFLKESFRGRHNIYNVLAAVAVSKVLGIESGVVRDVLSDFTGVEHRQEFVMTINGSGWINDSKATNLNAMRQALESAPGKVVLIAGGQDKGNDYATITGLIRTKVALIVAIGESKEKLVSAFEGVVPVKQAESLQAAVAMARNAVERGESVLFSPGCASFDMFENFEDRGRQFKQCVQQLSSC